MKKIVITCILFISFGSIAQKPDTDRMERDIAVAENVLQTLIRQQLQKQRMVFPLKTESYYQEGYGVTFYIPTSYLTPLTIRFDDSEIVLDGNAIGGVWNFSERPRDDRRQLEITESEIRLKEGIKAVSAKIDLDSLLQEYLDKTIEAARIFLLDYHTLLSQLPAQEKIVITNRGSQTRPWPGRLISSSGKMLISVEALKGDLNQYSTGKLSRDQMLNRINTVKTQITADAEPDLELFSSILRRLYSDDLSKTFFTDNQVPYERLKNFGVVFYLRLYSSHQRGSSYDMPTLKLENLDQATRDRKVKELYPLFEKEIKEYIVEYGRTIKSLQDNEQLILNVRLTRCADCGIPATLEAIVNAGVLKDYAGGKLSREAAIGKIVIKKGNPQ